MHAFLVYSVVFALVSTDAHVLPINYERQRKAILDQEALTAVGGTLQLTEDESILNDILMKLKYKELDYSFEDSQHLNFSNHYFTYKKHIEKSKVYQIIKMLPKGAVLHVHSSLMLNADTLLNLTHSFKDDLLYCDDDTGLLLNYRWRPFPDCSGEWLPYDDIRRDNPEFDKKFTKLFSIYEDDEEYNNNVDINTVWRKFDKVYESIKTFICYAPVREKYWYETLQQFYDDNVMYIEVRSGLHRLFDQNGLLEQDYMLKLFKRVTDMFIKDHPDFVGVKFIMTRHRTRSEEEILEAINLTRMLKAEMPDIVAGFDLVGQEDLGKPLTDFLPILEEAKNELNYYLHAGETVWSGSSTDENLIDAILLGTKRIGHGYALIKHPTLLSIVKKKNIAVEVNVISNVVLGLVRDVRNHPLATYLAMGLPVVLSSDDPGVWGATPLSNDFFVTFMGVASKRADLRMLKQLAINSIIYSSLDDEGCVKLSEVFSRRWSQFVQDMIPIGLSLLEDLED